MADKPQIYKRIPIRTTQSKEALSSAEQTQLTNIIGNFITYFKAKHT